MKLTISVAALSAFTLAVPLATRAQDNPDPIGVSGEDLVPASTTNVVGDPRPSSAPATSRTRACTI